jgi:hypothetical protein
MADFTLKDANVENLRPLKVRVIGAGYSGIVNAIRCAVLHHPRPDLWNTANVK